MIGRALNNPYRIGAITLASVVGSDTSKVMHMADIDPGCHSRGVTGYFHENYAGHILNYCKGKVPEADTEVGVDIPAVLEYIKLKTQPDARTVHEYNELQAINAIVAGSFTVTP